MEWLKKHNIAAKLLSLLVAILVWFFVIAEINPDMESRVRGLDVIVTDVDQLAANGLAIVDGGNERIDLRVSGKRDKLVLLAPDKFQVTASAAEITMPGTYKLNCKTVVDVDGVSVIAKNPSQITVVVDRVSSKTVPASIKFTGNMSSNYILENYTLSPDAIVVKGPQSQLEKIESAELSYNIDYLTRSLNTSLSYKLVDAKGAEVDTDELTVDTPAIVLSATVKAIKKVPLKLELISEGIFSESITKYVVEPSTVSVIGDYDVVNLINSIDLGTENIMSLIIGGKTELTYNIVLPNGVYTNDAVSSAKVTVTTPGYSVEEVVVSAEDIEPAEGYLYKSGETVRFKVFGPTDTVKKLTGSSMTIYPATVETGTNGEISIVLSAGVNNPEVIIIGEYSVEAVKVTSVD